MVSSRFASERELIEHAKQFQPEAWDQIYETYFSKMYNFVYVHVGDRTAAEDLASEVFEQACKGIHRFQYRGVPFSSWLYRIAHNLMVDFLKRRKRTPSRSLEAGGVPTTPVRDAADAISARDELVRAMQNLTGDQQQVIVLRHIEGHNVASTAQIMGKKENAIRALEFRALASLRRVMVREGRRE